MFVTTLPATSPAMPAIDSDGIIRSVSIESVIEKPCMTEIYLHFLFT
eukprot:COSAG05_NODE_21928_length_268_cov_0.615385_1_plen_46_part_10